MIDKIFFVEEINLIHVFTRCFFVIHIFSRCFFVIVKDMLFVNSHAQRFKQGAALFLHIFTCMTSYMFQQVPLSIT